MFFSLLVCVLRSDEACHGPRAIPVCEGKRPFFTPQGGKRQEKGTRKTEGYRPGSWATGSITARSNSTRRLFHSAALLTRPVLPQKLDEGQNAARTWTLSERGIEDSCCFIS